MSIAVSVHRPSKVRCASVHYLLAGQVAFEESMQPKGRRLNETKAQRSSLEPQYAPNEDLAILVQVAKPHLQATLKGNITRLGLGEETESTIVVRNAGRVALKNARVIINRPDALLDQSRVPRITPTGEMQVENDLRTAKTIDVPLLDDTLEGGSDFAWPVLVRGSALGILTLRLLFVYESEEGEVLTSQLEHKIHVEAVIDLAVQAGPSHSQDRVYNLKIDGINLTDPEEDESVTISALSFVGPAWKATAVREDALQSFQSLSCRKRQSVGVKLECSPSTMAIQDLDYTVSQLQLLLTGRTINKDSSAPVTTVNASHLGKEVQEISPFLLLARKEYRLSTLLSQFSSSISAKKDVQQIFPLYEPNEIDIIAHWQLSKSHRKGQAFVFGLHLGPLHDYLEKLFVKNDDRVTRSLYAEAEQEKAALWVDVAKNRLHMEEDPILFTYVSASQDAEQTVSHNFASDKAVSKRCVVNVDFVLCNLSSVRSRDVILQLDNTSIPIPLASTTVQAMYINRLTFRVTLAPQSSSRIQAQASVHRPGSIVVGPVLVKSTTSPGSGQDRTFQRWEHCNTPVKTVRGTSRG
jgi:hypothetical protein